MNASAARPAALDLKRTLERDGLLAALMEHLERLVAYDTASVLLRRGAGHLAVQATRGFERVGGAALAHGKAFEVASEPILQALLSERRSILIAETRDHPGWRRHAGGEHVRSWIGVPLVIDGRAIGLLGLDKTKPHFFTDEHVRLAEALASFAAIGIRNASLFEAMQRSEERFHALAETSVEGISLLSEEGVVLYATPSSCAILGLAQEALLGRRFLELLHPDDRPLAERRFRHCVAKPGRTISGQARIRHRDGSWRTVESVAVNRLDEGAVAAVVANWRDVTERRATKRRIEQLNRDLRRQLDEFRTLIDVLPIGIAVARDRECRYLEPNRCLARMFGVPAERSVWPSPQEPEAPAPVRFFRDGRLLLPSELPMQLAAQHGTEVVEMEMEMVRDGTPPATVLGYAAPLFDEQGMPRGAIGACLDITERKRAEETARSLAHHDSLTGLPNRLLLHDRMVQATALCRRERRHLGVLFMDLDGFKLVNDSLGHGRGDRLLQMVADRLRSCVREVDTVARLGGDEFTLVVPGLFQETDAAAVATKVLEALRRQPFTVEGHDLYVTGSMGISVFPADGDDPETLLKNADAAMYRAKEQGRDQYQLYAPAMNVAAMARLSVESGLRRALANGELVLYYQPLIHLGQRRVYGVEALLRWKHPERGLLPPADFIGVAEVTGLVLDFGPWVLRTACAQVKRWQEGGFPELCLSVNLTARQFDQPDLVEQVATALQETGLAPRFLDLEITESRAMQSAETAIGTLRRLKALGVRISIDDFGTGYSSLAYLTRFPIDTLKIDQSFIRDITRDADDAALTTAMIAMAHTLNLQVVAEGVETQQQLRFLMAGRCDRMQGYLFSRPLPAEECERALARSWPKA